MGAILQDLILTHPADLTQRTGRKTVSVRGQVIDMAQVKRYIRRKGLPASHVEPWSDTGASPTGSTICPQTLAPLLVDAMKACPSLSAPDEQSCPPILPSSNPLALYPPYTPFHAPDPRPGQLTFQHTNSTAQERTLPSTSAHDSISGEERQPKRQRPSHQTLTCTNLACPFYKHNPAYYNPQNPDTETGRRYRCCAGPGWTNIRRLRQVTPRRTLLLPF
jgi:hypothetical protein